MLCNPRLTIKGSANRQAFTLIELLVTIAIIGVVAAISVGAYFAVMGSEQTRNTRTELQKIQIVLNRQWKATTDDARKETIGTFPAGIVPATPDESRAQWIMLRQRQAFPTSFAAVFAPNVNTDLAALPLYVQYLNNIGVNAGNYNATTASAELQSSICLLMAVKRAKGGAGFSSSDLGTSTVRSFDIGTGTAAQALADGWQQPIALFIRTNTVSGQLQQTPFLVSSGADGQMGTINASTMAPGDAAANDNLFSKP